ncbi:hypothetical protein [Rhizobium sp. WW_1]|jgi:hypothetical protein|uniref:hypothetical protein n=1 Tax=Rhizobium sp. WW_1 TaxID=1907375 RepID=UPI000646C3C1|nr:hypothetical protein [Rhizobium sp. WW_1]RKD69020.1 hypothetical protein BJ928_104158 [Rhizobium sp. WW_1]
MITTPEMIEAAKAKGREIAGNQPGALVEAFAEVAEAGAVAALALVPGEPVAILSKFDINGFDVNGGEIHPSTLFPKGTLRPENEFPLYAAPPAAVQEPVAVKAMEDALAWLAIQRVAIRVTGDGYYSCTEVDEDGDYVTYDDAIQAIGMIRSALSTSPSDPAPEIAALRAENERLRGALIEVLPMAEDMWSNPENIPEIVKARAAIAPQQEEA